MRAWLLLAPLLLALPPASAQNSLPQRFAGWREIPGTAGAVPLARLAPADATLLRNCHEQEAERASYERNGARLDVILYRMGDPSWAYSAYSVLRPVPATDFRPAPHASVGADRAAMLVGDLLLEISGHQLPADAKDFLALARALQPRASNEPYPTLWQFLPPDHLAPHSDRYALDPVTLRQELSESPSAPPAARPNPSAAAAWPAGDWLGFDDDVEAETGRYDIAGKQLTLILASYPTPELAAAHIRALSRWFLVNPQPRAEIARPVLYARRFGSLAALVAVAGPPDPLPARSLLDAIRYRTVVTWNEPGFTATDLSIPQYLLGIFFSTASILLIIVIAGVSLGLLRVTVKRRWPGRFFDRRRSLEVLQLGLTTKPIDPADFY